MTNGIIGCTVRCMIYSTTELKIIIYLVQKIIYAI